MICRKAGVPVQRYSNRADLPGGSTLGNISSAHLSVAAVDVGLAQLAMHSSYESAGAEDPEYMKQLASVFYREL
jgi:aspartyl aminopeptidase